MRRPVEDDAEDYACLLGRIVPLRLIAGAPIRDDRCDPAISVPDYAAEYSALYSRLCLAEQVFL